MHINPISKCTHLTGRGAQMGNCGMSGGLWVLLNFGDGGALGWCVSGAVPPAEACCPRASATKCRCHHIACTRFIYRGAWGGRLITPHLAFLPSTPPPAGQDGCRHCAAPSICTGGEGRYDCGCNKGVCVGRGAQGKARGVSWEVQ